MLLRRPASAAVATRACLLTLLDLKFASSLASLGACFRGVAGGHAGSMLQAHAAGEGGRRLGDKRGRGERGGSSASVNKISSSSSDPRSLSFRLYLTVLQSQTFLRTANVKSLLGILKLLREEFAGVDAEEVALRSMTSVVNALSWQLTRNGSGHSQHSSSSAFLEQNHGAVVSVSIAITTHGLLGCDEFLAFVDAVVSPALLPFSRGAPVDGFKLAALVATAVAAVRGTAATEDRAVQVLQRLARPELCLLWQAAFEGQASRGCVSLPKRGGSGGAATPVPCLRCMPIWQMSKFSGWWLKSHALLGIAPPLGLLLALCGSPLPLAAKTATGGTTGGDAGSSAAEGAAGVSAISHLFTDPGVLCARRRGDGETRLFDAARTLKNLHGPLSTMADRTDRIRLSAMFLAILNEQILVQLTTVLDEVLARTGRLNGGGGSGGIVQTSMFASENLGRAVFRAVSQCAVKYGLDPAIRETAALGPALATTAERLVCIVERTLRLTQTILKQLSRTLFLGPPVRAGRHVHHSGASLSPAASSSHATNVLPIRVARIPCQLISVCLSTEFFLSNVSPPTSGAAANLNDAWTAANAHWASLAPELALCIRQCLEAKLPW